MPGQPPDDQDWSLLHARARKIESASLNGDYANAAYWVDMTKQQLDFINSKLQSAIAKGSEEKSRYPPGKVKVF